jgi:CzcA family heavy metal efflux pump
MNRTSSTLAVLAVVAATALGILLAFSIPSAVFPEITFDRAIILTDAGNLPAEQVLVSVTRPIEEAAYGVVGVSLVRSTTTRGASEVDVTFGEHTDPLTSYQLLNAALAEVRSRLPQGTSVDTRLLTTGTFPIVDVSLSSRDRTLPELTDIAFYDLVPSFHRIAGVYRVEMVGGKYREFVVTLDQARMLAHGLSPQQVVAGLARANIIASPGRIIDAHRMLLAIVSTELHTASQIAAVPIAEAGGQPVYVRDIASVGLGIREDYIRTASENGPAVLVGISRQPTGNTVLISREAHRIIDQFRKRYPDVKFSFSYDQAGLVVESVKSVRDAIVLGLALAVLVVLAFTGSLLSALIAAVVVPCTIAITFLVMKTAGLTFNMMTLGGLAAGIGLFIDDAIVMIEAIHRAHAGGIGTDDAIPLALAELKRPLIASTATVIVVFAPLVLLSGVTGVFFRALAVTLGAGLAISLIAALYFTPALEVFFGRIRRPGRQSGALFDFVRRAYVGLTGPFMRVPVLSLALAAASIAGGYALYRSVGTDYLPRLDEGAFVLDYLTPPESSLHDTQALLAKIQHILKTTPEVAAFSRRTGTQLGFFVTESNRGDFSVRLKPDRTRSIYSVIDSVRARVLHNVPGVNVEFSQMLQDLIGDLSGTPEPVEVKVFGSDEHTIEATARAVAARLRQIPGLVDVFDGIVLSNPEEKLIVNQTQAQRYGISPADVYAALHCVIQGTVATDVRVGDRLYGVRVRYPDLFHNDLSALSEVILKTPSNGRVPLPVVTRLKYLGERAELDRERLRPVVHVTARLSGIDLGTAMHLVRDRLGRMILPAGVTLEYGGLYAQQQKAFGQLTVVLVAGTVVIFLILVWEFGRLGPAVACLVAALASLAGSFAGLSMTRVTLNISSFMGIIMVAGITAKNGILLLDRAEHAIGIGATPREALLHAAEIRLRPIMMTTLATAAGLAPLAMGIGAGAKVQQPLAIAVIGGLVFAMLLSTPIAGGIYLLTTRARTAAPKPDDSDDIRD